MPTERLLVLVPKIQWAHCFVSRLASRTVLFAEKTFCIEIIQKFDAVVYHSDNILHAYIWGNWRLKLFLSCAVIWKCHYLKIKIASKFALRPSQSFFAVIWMCRYFKGISVSYLCRIFLLFQNFLTSEKSCEKFYHHFSKNV